MQQIKLVAVDMDGTLLKSDKTLHPDTIRDIEEAAKAGLQTVYCWSWDFRLPWEMLKRRF